MWQKSKYLCYTSLNRLLKTVEEVDDLSNSGEVKSTVTRSESQMGTSGILLIAISPTSIFAFLIISYSVFQRNLWLILCLHIEFGIWDQTQHHKLDFLGLAFSLRIYCRANFSLRISNGGSWASAYKLSTVEERNGPRLRRRPWLWTGTSFANVVLEADPQTIQP